MMLRGKTAQNIQEKTWAGKLRPGNCAGDSVVVTQRMKSDNPSIPREFVKHPMQHLRAGTMRQLKGKRCDWRLKVCA